MGILYGLADFFRNHMDSTPIFTTLSQLTAPWKLEIFTLFGDPKISGNHPTSHDLGFQQLVLGEGTIRWYGYASLPETNIFAPKNGWLED